MHNTTCNDSLINTCSHWPRKKFFPDFVQFVNKSSSPFLSLGYVFSLFLNFEHFSASRSYKKTVLIMQISVWYSGMTSYVHEF